MIGRPRTPVQPEDPTPFAAWLRREMRASRLSQRQLARRASVSHSTISRLLSETRQPSYRTAYRLARCLGALTLNAPPVDDLDDIDSGPSILARVEHALRADPLLRGVDVRDLMRAYVRLRRHRSVGHNRPPIRLRPLADEAAAPLEHAPGQPLAASGGRRR